MELHRFTRRLLTAKKVSFILLYAASAGRTGLHIMCNECGLQQAYSKMYVEVSVIPNGAKVKILSVSVATTVF